MLSSASSSSREGKSSKIQLWPTKRFRRETSPRLSHGPPPHALPHKQLQSQLLSNLPLEFRRKIYGNVIDSFGSVQHIVRVPNSNVRGRDKGSRLTHVRCSLTSHPPFQHYYRKNPCYPHDSAYRSSLRNSWHIFSLLLSCKKIYAEAIEILYLYTTFRFSYDYVATQFIDTVPARYLALANLHLTYSLTNPMYWPTDIPSQAERRWEDFWQALGNVRVRTLNIEVIDAGESVPDERALLQPLIILNSLGKAPSSEVVVLLPWPKNLETSANFDDKAGFVVRRPPEEMGTDLMVKIGKIEPGKTQSSFPRTRLREDNYYIPSPQFFGSYFSKQLWETMKACKQRGRGEVQAKIVAGDKKRQIEHIFQ